MDVLEATAGIFYKPYEAYKSGRSATTPSLKSDSQSVLDEDSMRKDNGEGSSQSSEPSKPPSKNVAGAMALASAKSFGNLYTKGFKGLAVDIPLAATEGFRNVPALYGEQVRNNGTVTDWKSGAIVGGKVRFSVQTL